MKRYSAKLLFQFRVDLGAQSGKRRTCEERIIVFSAGSEAKAVSEAKRLGRGSEFSYVNDAGTPVHFEFVGVIDLLRHGPEMEHGEVWYEVKDRLLPKERRTVFVRSDRELLQRASR